MIMNPFQQKHTELKFSQMITGSLLALLSFYVSNKWSVYYECYISSEVFFCLNYCNSIRQNVEQTPQSSNKPSPSGQFYKQDHLDALILEVKQFYG